MDSRVYRKLASLDTLSSAWHHATLDSRDDFILDAWSYSDYAMNRSANLTDISRRLLGHEYTPRPLAHIDIPKSTLAVRPGSVVDIEDKVVIWASLIAAGRNLDKVLGPSVYSYRLRKRPTRRSFFERHDLLDYPFLRAKTILESISEFEPWFYAWLEFTNKTFETLRKAGFTFLVTTDISSYFENIDLSILRSQLAQRMPNDQDAVHLLVDILEDWTWPAYVGTPSPRGIPQGNDVSGFLGSFYLHPVDAAILRASRGRPLFYARYVDDMVILTKSRTVAIEIILELTRELRRLRLTVQGAKTQIIEGPSRIRERLTDPRLERVNKVLKLLEAAKPSTARDISAFASRLRAAASPMRREDGFYVDKELRLFRRLITGYSRLGHSGMVRIVLSQLKRNADQRLLLSSIRYFRALNSTTPKTAASILSLLDNSEIFPYQRACLLSMLRELGQDVTGMRKTASDELRSNSNWHVRHEAARLLGSLPLSERELLRVKPRFVAETNSAVKRALVTCLIQSGVVDVRSLAQDLLLSSEPSLHRLGAYLLTMTSDPGFAKSKASDLFRDLDEKKLQFRFQEIELMSKSDNREIRSDLLTRMRSAFIPIRRPVLLSRWNRTAYYLSRSLRRS